MAFQPSPPHHPPPSPRMVCRVQPASAVSGDEPPDDRRGAAPSGSAQSSQITVIRLALSLRSPQKKKEKKREKEARAHLGLPAINLCRVLALQSLPPPWVVAMERCIPKRPGIKLKETLGWLRFFYLSPLNEHAPASMTQLVLFIIYLIS